MACLDRMQVVVNVFRADCHRRANIPQVHLSATSAHVRPDGQDIVKWCHVVGIALAQEDREILGVPVRGSHEPENQLHEQEDDSVR